MEEGKEVQQEKEKQVVQQEENNKEREEKDDDDDSEGEDESEDESEDEGEDEGEGDEDSSPEFDQKGTRLWEVKEILSMKTLLNGKTRYRVKWKGSATTTWLDEDRMQQCKVLLAQFKAKNKAVPEQNKAGKVQEIYNQLMAVKTKELNQAGKKMTSTISYRLLDEARAQATE